MENNELVSSKITGYEFDEYRYKQNRYIHLIIIILSIIIIPFGNVFSWILFIIGYILFIERIKTRSKLDKLKREVITNLNLPVDELDIDTYFEYMKRIKLFNEE